MLSLSHLVRSQATRRTALAAAAAISSAAILVNTKEHDDDESHPSFFPLHNTACEGAFLSFPLRMRRHSTVELLEEIKAEESLEDKYRVDWMEPLGEGSFGAVYAAFDKKVSS